MPCTEQHTIRNLPGGVYILQCGITTVARIELEPGDQKQAVEKWVTLAIKTHAERAPRPCVVSSFDNAWCYGESHSECHEV